MATWLTVRSLALPLPLSASSVTGNALEEDVQAFILAGAHEVLTKPVSRAKLEAALGRYCPNQPTGAAAASNSSHGH